MRVGLVCPYSLSLSGGVQTQVLGLGRVLRRLGVDTRILGPCDGPPPEAAVTPLGNSVPTAANGSMAAIAPDPSAALRTLRALRDERFDVVHLHEPYVPGPTLTALVVRPGPLVGTFHRAGESHWYRLVRPVRRWTVDHLDVRVAVSAAAASTARTTFGGDYTVLWNGVDIEQFAGLPPWPSPGPTVLFVGRHEPRKGLGTLLDAAELLPSEVTVWVAGDGPQSAALRGGAQRPGAAVEWLGTVGESEKLRRLAAADVFCAPSLHGESFGVVLLEGLAAGAAVVASDLEGYRNVVRPGVDGYLTPPGDPGALAAAIRRALDAGGRHSPLAAAGRSRAREFGMDRLALRYLEISQQAAEAGRGSGGRRRRTW